MYRLGMLCVVVPLILLLLAGCKEEATRWDQAQEQTQGRQAPAVAKKAAEV